MSVNLNILIVKLSSLGDVVHAMAALQDIRRAFPYARIDWVVAVSYTHLDVYKRQTVSKGRQHVGKFDAHSA